MGWRRPGGSAQSQSPSQPPLHPHRLLELAPPMRHPGASPPGRLPSAFLQAQGRPPACGVLLDWRAPSLAGSTHCPGAPCPLGTRGTSAPWWPSAGCDLHPPLHRTHVHPTERPGFRLHASSCQDSPQAGLPGPRGTPRLCLWRPGRQAQAGSPPTPTRHQYRAALSPHRRLRTLSYQKHTGASPGPLALLPPEWVWPWRSQPRAGPASAWGLRRARGDKEGDTGEGHGHPWHSLACSLVQISHHAPRAAPLSPRRATRQTPVTRPALRPGPGCSLGPPTPEELGEAPRMWCPLMGGPGHCWTGVGLGSRAGNWS